MKKLNLINCVFFIVSFIAIVIVNHIDNQASENYIDYIDYVMIDEIEPIIEIDTIAVIIEIIDETQMLMPSARKLSEDNKLLVAETLYKESIKKGLKLEYVLAIARQESRFRHEPTSHAGAKGIMQIMPATFKNVAKKYKLDYDVEEIFDIEKNIEVSTLLMQKLLHKYNRYDNVSIAYNAGPKYIKRYKDYKDGLDVRIPQETLNYIKSVNKYMKEYEKRLQ